MRSQIDQVYVIKCEQYYKIGISKDIEKRLYQIGKMNPFDLELIKCYYIKNIVSKECRRIENYIHTAFSTKRVRGEWFSLNEADLALIPSLIKDAMNVKPKTDNRFITIDEKRS